MALYRADFIDTEGKARSPVTNAMMERMPFSGDLLTHHMSTIRPIASEAAQKFECDVAIRSITGAGRIRTVLIATFDGRFRRPDNTTSTATTDHNTDGPCFCAACRAERRDAKRARGTAQDPLGALEAPPCADAKRPIAGETDREHFARAKGGNR